MNISKKILKNIFTSYDRPKVEYASPVLSSHLRKLEYMLDRVQLLVTRIIIELGNLSYRGRMAAMDVSTVH